MGGRYLKEAPKPKRGKKIAIIILCIVLTLVILGVAAVIMIKNFVLGEINTLEDITVPTTVTTVPTQPSETGVPPTETTSPLETWPKIVATQNVTNIMLVGQNYREGEEHKLSDTMILCSINRETKTLTMTSFLRDLYVPLPAYAGHGAGRNRMNVCYHLGSQWTGSVKGGMEMLALCVEQNFGIPVHYTVEVDFRAFEKIVDLLGGVEIEVTEAEADYLTRIVAYVGEVKPGLQTLNGVQALGYARIREIDSDFARTNRQRTIITSLIKKCTTMGLMDLLKIAKEILPMVTTDMSQDQIMEYIWEFLPMLKDLKIVSQRVPLEKSELGAWSFRGIEVEGVGNVLEPNFWSHKKYLQEQLGFADAE